MSVVRRDSSPVQEASHGWQPYLDRTEKVIWEGAPSSGLKFRAADLVQSFFGLFFLGFSIFWVVMASRITSGSSGHEGIALFFPLFGLPFVAVGAYLVFGRFFWKSYLRSKTRYALTEKRAIVATNTLRRKLKSYPIGPNTRLDYEPGAEATIWFAEEERQGSKGRRYTVKHGFEYIPDGDNVYRLMRRIQQGEAI
ncbi:MAG: aspartate carbamoyltransferase catalytic subunit [Paracoccaceae bacterium]